MAVSEKINHIGMAVPSIEQFLEKNSAIYGTYEKGPLIVNETQKVKECFITDGQHVIELLEPLEEGSPLDGFLKKNPAGGLLHLAFDVADIEAALAQLEEEGARVITPPTPDIAFDYRNIAFVFHNGQIIELIQEEK